MRLPNIKIPQMILNDDLECTVKITSKEVDIDGKQKELTTCKTYKCIYQSCNKITYSIDKVETIARGEIKINGDIISDKANYYGGTVKIFGIEHDILSIEKFRNLFNPQIIDYTVITV